MKVSWEGRVLAVDPMSRAFGFVVLETPESLVDWGVRQTRTDKQQATLAKVSEIVNLYRPDVVVVEDCLHESSRRRERIRILVEAIVRLGAEIAVDVRRIPRSVMVLAFADAGAPTKHGIARALAERFPEVARHLPPIRKPWMAEDDRFAIFDALALAVAFVDRGAHSD